MVEISINGKPYRMKHGQYSVGRQGDEPFRSAMRESFFVSRKHMQLEISENEVVAIDIGSLNGTYKNGYRISKEVLKVGDEIVLGDTSKQCSGAASIVYLDRI